MLTEKLPDGQVSSMNLFEFFNLPKIEVNGSAWIVIVFIVIFIIAWVVDGKK